MKNQHLKKKQEGFDGTRIAASPLKALSSNKGFGSLFWRIRNETINRQKAFVRGGSKGIGFAIADHLASDGADVFIVSSNTERLNIAKGKMQNHQLKSAAQAIEDIQSHF